MIKNAISSTASLVLLMFLGYLMGKTKAIEEHGGEKVLAYMQASWILPIFVFYNVYNSFSGRDEIINLLKNLPIPFFLIGIMLAFGALAAKLMHIDRSRKGAFIDGHAFANTSFIGFPLITSLFGPKSITVCMIYYVANTLMFFTAGTWLLGLDAGNQTKPSLKESLKKIFSPMVIALIIGLIVKMLNITLPAFMCTAMGYFSSVSPCLGMIFVGIVIRQNKLDVSYIKDISKLLGMRYLIIPFVIGFTLLLLPIDNEAKTIFFVLSLMPSVTQLSIMSQVIGSDSAFCAVWLTVSTVVGVVYIPVIVMMAEKVFHFI